MWVINIVQTVEGGRGGEGKGAVLQVDHPGHEEGEVKGHGRGNAERSHGCGRYEQGVLTYVVAHTL